MADIEEIYRAQLPRFLRVSAAVTGDEALAADAVHNAFVDLIRYRDGFRKDGTLEAWIWTGVVNSARRLVSRRPSETLTPAISDEGSNGSGTLDDYLDAQLGELVAALPERQRLALFLRYYGDHDYRTIGAIMGIASGTVAALLSAAHRSLEVHLTEELAHD